MIENSLHTCFLGNIAFDPRVQTSIIEIDSGIETGSFVPPLCDIANTSRIVSNWRKYFAQSGLANLILDNLTVSSQGLEKIRQLNLRANPLRFNS